jgi:hypothetical protein
MADMVYHIIFIQKSFLIKLSSLLSFLFPKMHEMVLMLFLIFHASFQFEKILLCYHTSRRFWTQTPDLVIFLNISKSSAHPFSAKASKCKFFFCGELKSKISNLAWHYPLAELCRGRPGPRPAHDFIQTTKV